MATAEELLDLFLELVGTPSPSGSERAVADIVLARLRAAGLDPLEDDSASQTGAGSGNIHVVVPVRDAGGPGVHIGGADQAGLASRPTGVAILLGAHLDTVAVEGGVVTPVVVDGVVRSDGGSILGADDKVAVAVLIALLEDLAAEPPAQPVEVLFTASEEVGLRGAKAFNVGGSQAAAAFVLDSSGPLGQIIISAPSQRTVKAQFHGVAAHAGIEPERGRSAIVAAARAVASMRLGRIDDVTTANVGIIQGGVAINIVPERCELCGETRSRDQARLAAQLSHMVDAINLAAAEVGVDVTVTVHDEYESFSLSKSSLPARLAAEALRAMGIKPAFIGTGGGSDVNVFNAKGLRSVNLSAGYEQVHTSAEHMPLDRLNQAYRLVQELVAAAGRADAG